MCAPQIAAQPTNELTAIAAAIERVEALLTTGGPAPEGADAIERIADIAFVLHERDVEASLCDALDAAVRELGNANAARHADVLHVRQAAELLRELSQRVADMIALLQVSPPPAANDTAATEAAPQEGEPAPAELPTGEDALDGEIPREGLFGAELLEDDEFAQAVAELAASLPPLAQPVEAVVVMLREPADLAVDEPAPAPEPHPAGSDSPVALTEPIEAVVVTLHERADLAAAEPTAAPELDEAIPETQAEHAALAVEEPAPAPKLDEAIPETQDKLADLAADESTLAPEPADLAAEEPTPAPELDAAIPEAQDGPAEFAADEAFPAPAPEQAVPETQHQPTEFAADGPTLAPEQQPAMGDAPAAIEPPPAEEFPIAEAINAPLACDDVVLVHDALADEPNDDANATLLSESALSETLSGEALLVGADAPPSSDLPEASPDHSLLNGHTVALSPDIDSPHIPSEALSPPVPEAMPDSETAQVPDSSPLAASVAEPELPSRDEPISPPADIATSVTAAEQPYGQDMPRDAGDGPTQIVSESNPYDAVEAATETATHDEPPPHVTESSQSLLPELALVDPQDDPGDLFEPTADAATPIVAATLAVSGLASEISIHAVAMKPHSAAATVDPLAAMHTLSAEELLALFT
ncbi:MAG TPA: hypothetical protein VIJ04_18040 [Xanthobacteraceae bacterium]